MEFECRGAVAPILALWALMLLAGCGGGVSSSSGSYATDNIDANIYAIKDESGNITTTVRLRPSGMADYLHLSDEDILFSSLDDPPQQYLDSNGNIFSSALDVSQHLKYMSSRDLFFDYGLFTSTTHGQPEYFAVDTPKPSSAPTRAYVAFVRSGNSFGDSSVEVPAAFQITAPAGGAALSRSTPLTLAWTDADPTTTIEADVALVCAGDQRYTKHLYLGGDSGLYVLQATNYFPNTFDPSFTCSMAVSVERVRLGSVSAKFAFGSFKGIQKRTVQFTSTP